MKPWLKKRADQLISELEGSVNLPFVIAHGCCQPELENVTASTYDWSRLGVGAYASDPTAADLLIVAGWINERVAEELKKAYASLVGSRFVMAVGACAIGGGPYRVGQTKVVPLSDILPVDVYVPGCPPRPEALIDGIRMLRAKIKPGPDRKTILHAAFREQL